MRARQDQRVHGPRHAHVAEPALFFELSHTADGRADIPHGKARHLAAVGIVAAPGRTLVNSLGQVRRKLGGAFRSALGIIGHVGGVERLAVGQLDKVRQGFVPSLVLSERRLLHYRAAQHGGQLIGRLIGRVVEIRHGVGSSGCGFLQLGRTRNIGRPERTVHDGAHQRLNAGGLACGAGVGRRGSSGGAGCRTGCRGGCRGGCLDGGRLRGSCR